MRRGSCQPESQTFLSLVGTTGCSKRKRAWTQKAMGIRRKGQGEVTKSHMRMGYLLSTECKQVSSSEENSTL